MEGRTVLNLYDKEELKNGKEVYYNTPVTFNDVKKGFMTLVNKDDDNVMIESCSSLEEVVGLNNVAFEIYKNSETPNNAFLGALHHAFCYHLDLVLSPDDIWMTISQGFSNHVKLNAEALRGYFVENQGKKKKFKSC